jgi:hypothetical protein
MTAEAIRQLQEAFDQAELDGDRAKLAELIDDDFVWIGPRGFLLDKEQWIDRHDKFSYDELETSEWDVRVHDGTAIVRDVQRNRSRYGAEQLEFAFRVGQVWLRQNGDWKLAAIQFSPLADEAAGR